MATTPAAGGRVRQSVLPSASTVYNARDPSNLVTQNMSGKAGFQYRPVITSLSLVLLKLVEDKGKSV